MNRNDARIKTTTIVSPNYEKQKRIHSRLQKKNERIDEVFEKARQEWILEPPEPMLVVLNQDFSQLPGGYVLQVPAEIGCYLLCKRLGRIIIERDVKPDLVVEGSIEDLVGEWVEVAA
jgi:hypothetical protein